MVVDLLQGGDLRYHIDQGVVFSDDSIRLFALEAAHALDYLREKLIIHRYLILIKPRGGGGLEFTPQWNFILCKLLAKVSSLTDLM